MNDFDAINRHAYGPGWAGLFERYFGQLPDTEDAVATLAELAAGRRVLEFGVGTGRLALPLRATGLDVHGIDNSEPMLEQLRRKPDGDRLPVTLGDIATAKVDGGFGLVFVATHTLLALRTQDAQVRCFDNAAAHLDSGGLFVVEVMSPHARALSSGDCRTVEVDPEQITLYVAVVDPIAQLLQGSALYLRDRELPVVRTTASRYIWPSELDLMARVAGLRLQDRWGGWTRTPFTAGSPNQVSVFAKP
ncbi:MAG: class I SAM-dependent DNA methyltransferase [Solirubrobacteraceae bacterium]